MIMRIKKEHLILYFISIIFILSLCFLYQDYIVPIFDRNIAAFGRYGYPSGEFSIYKFSFLLVYLFLLVPFVPIKIVKPSDLIIIIYYFVTILPFFSLFVLSLTYSSNIEYIDFLIIYLFFLSSKIFLNLKKTKKFHSIFCNFYSFNKDNTYIKYLIVLLTFLISIILYFKLGAHSLVTSVLDVYKQRLIFNHAGFLINYIVSFLSFGFLPYLLYEYYYKNKNYFMLIIIFIFYFIIFLVTGSKLVFFGFLLIIVLYYKYKRYYYSNKLGIYLLFLLLISLLFVKIFNNYVLISLFVRRLLILPAQIFNLYFQYFSIHDFNYLSAYTHNFFNTSYNESASFVIGSEYFNEGVHANSGILSDSYANFGIIGNVVYIFIFIILFRFVDKLDSYFCKVLIPLFGVIGISLTNSSLLAVIVYQILPLIFIFLLKKIFSKKYRNIKK
jgi:hypothetical protein